MADINVFRLMAAGPTSLLQAVESDSLTLDPGIDRADIFGQRLAPISVFSKSVSKPFTLTQAYVGWSGLTLETSFGLYWQAFADDGGLGAAGISVVGKALIIPQSVRCSQGGTAGTNLRCIFFDTEPTVGTTTATPASVTTVYMNGPSTFNNSALDGIVEQEIDFGLSVVTNVGMGGKLFPTQYWVSRNAPTIRLRTTDLNIVKTYIPGATLSSNACTLKFMNTTGTAGYQYVCSKAYVEGSIRGAIGTLTLTALHDTTICAGAAY